VSKNYIQGFYSPVNPEKYSGDYRNIVYRSSYELRAFKWCDLTENIISWGSEEGWVPYKNPITGRVHRYFPDLFIEVKETNGQIKKYIIEIKPKRQTIPPNPSPKKKTKTWLNEMKTYQVNQAKWEAAERFCQQNGFAFKIITEQELGIR
jgi:hypothetical protein